MFRQRLSDLLAAVPGARAACLVAGDGIAVDSVGGDDLDLEVLAAETVAMAKSIANEQRGLEIGGAQRFEVLADACAFILSRLQEDYYLLLVVDSGPSLARARFEVRRASPTFERDLI